MTIPGTASGSITINPKWSVASTATVKALQSVSTGYVGLVTGTCLAEVGNDVLSSMSPHLPRRGGATRHRESHEETAMRRQGA
jgi:hypothetical protein